jgi:di/tricarboxylate transporter
LPWNDRVYFLEANETGIRRLGADSFRGALPFWTQRLRTDITALLVMLSLALPWPRPEGKWSAILSPQEAFSGFGSVAVIMVTAMFVFGAALVRTGAAEMIGGRLFRACAHDSSFSNCGSGSSHRFFHVHQ